MLWHVRPMGCGLWLPEDKKLKRGTEGNMLWLIATCLPQLATDQVGRY